MLLQPYERGIYKLISLNNINVTLCKDPSHLPSFFVLLTSFISMIFTLAGTVDVAYLQHLRACAWYDGCICIYVTRWSNRAYHA